jgi:hypothetical protein
VQNIHPDLYIVEIQSRTLRSHDWKFRLVHALLFEQALKHALYSGCAGLSSSRMPSVSEQAALGLRTDANYELARRMVKSNGNVNMLR